MVDQQGNAPCLPHCKCGVLASITTSPKSDIFYSPRLTTVSQGRGRIRNGRPLQCCAELSGFGVRCDRWIGACIFQLARYQSGRGWKRNGAVGGFRAHDLRVGNSTLWLSELQPHSFIFCREPTVCALAGVLPSTPPRQIPSALDNLQKNKTFSCRPN